MSAAPRHMGMNPEMLRRTVSVIARGQLCIFRGWGARRFGALWGQSRLLGSGVLVCSMAKRLLILSTTVLSCMSDRERPRALRNLVCHLVSCPISLSAPLRVGKRTRGGAPEKRAAFCAFEGIAKSAAIYLNSAVEDSTPGLPFRVAGSKGERLPTLYPEHLARRRRRVPGAAQGTVSPAAPFSLYLQNGQHFSLRRPGGAHMLRPSQSKAVLWRIPLPDYPFE